MKKCPKCKGKGSLLEVLEMHGIPHIMNVVCDKCEGTGKVKEKSNA